ncbi:MULTISPECIES: hypothetical protein [Mesorhizobium]|uniref:Periplasmic protein-like protein n=2 Tax=Mesorhizobium TaxID=68287 RepID=A0A1A5IN87_RHILI|nr:MULTISPECIES: hypothetical protein [Mesorhizobium]MBE1706729.1 hypothetical protein [Mesorhizobium japonicum]MBE1714760.1 hypothetical protein [Mesorhizobium japonicum]MUT22922.1 hypothetical protein [Mesorhizobium japonicum]MUT27038.1 hypothetical protein [Mesorhizobium japonicum]OBP80654.1 hypothetical protein BAE42_03215 [Mesorhizobium loti]
MLIVRWLSILELAVCLCFGWNAAAANIHHIGSATCTYGLSGDIALGDLESLTESGIRGGDKLCLDSEGGSFVVGLDIAEWLVSRDIETVLVADAKCYSACALIFMGGSDWEEIYLPRRRMHVSAKLGFHAPYLVLPRANFTSEDITSAYAIGLRAVARMMKLGEDRGGEGFIANRVILELLSKGPSELYYVDNVLKANELGIALDGVQKPMWTERDACNACIVKNEGRAVEGVCEQPATASKIGKSTTQFVFNGFAGEGAYSCAVRTEKHKDGVVSAKIVQTFIPGEELGSGNLPFVELVNSDSLSPSRSLGK